MPSFDKVMHWLKTLIFSYLRFIKAVASDQHNYANNIKMIKGVHQLTLRPNTLISLIDHFTIFNGFHHGRMDGRTHARIQDFCQWKGVQARRPAYRIRTWDQYIPTYVHAHTHARTHTHTHTHMYRQQTDTWMFMHRQTDRHTCTCIDGKLKYIQINRNGIIMYRDNVRNIGWMSRHTCTCHYI